MSRLLLAVLFSLAVAGCADRQGVDNVDVEVKPPIVRIIHAAEVRTDQTTEYVVHFEVTNPNAVSLTVPGLMPYRAEIKGDAAWSNSPQVLNCGVGPNVQAFRGRETWQFTARIKEVDWDAARVGFDWWSPSQTRPGQWSVANVAWSKELNRAEFRN